MKIIRWSFVLAFVFSITVINAQQNTLFSLGNQNLSFQSGFSSLYKDTINSKFPSLGISYELGLFDNIGIRVLGIYSSSKQEIYSKDTISINNRYFILGAQPNIYFDVFHIKKMEQYAGLTLGYLWVANHFEQSLSSDNLNMSKYLYKDRFIFSVYTGLNYQITHKWKIYIEGGYGIDWVSVGVQYIIW